MIIFEIAIEKAKMDITNAIMRTKQETGLPMHMIELIVSGILGDIRDEKCRGMVAEILKEERGEEKKDGGNDDSTDKPDDHEKTEI